MKGDKRKHRHDRRDTAGDADMRRHALWQQQSDPDAGRHSYDRASHPIAQLFVAARGVAGDDTGGRPDHPLSVIDMPPFDSAGCNADSERGGYHGFALERANAEFASTQELS